MRKASAPASISFLIISGLLDAGPRVARILTLRERGRSGSVTSNLSWVRWAHNGLRRGFNRVERMPGLAYSRTESQTGDYDKWRKVPSRLINCGFSSSVLRGWKRI